MTPHPLPSRAPTARPALPRATRRPVALASAALLAVLALAGCSAGASSSSSGGAVAGAGAQGAARAAGPPAGPGAPAVADASGQKAVGPVLAQPAQRLVRTASLLLRVTDVGSRASDVRAIAVGAGGVVTAEDLTSVDPGDGSTPAPTPVGADTTDVPVTKPSVLSTSGSMTLSVPSSRLDATLDQLARLGTVAQRQITTQDVTGTYVDTASRVKTMSAGLDRVRALLARADNLGQVVSIEAELTKRESDLESLKAQLASLDQQTTMSTISLSLTAATPPAPGTDDGSGFLGGLRSGWRGFAAFMTGLATVLGAALPFVATLAVIGVPLLAWERRRRTRRLAVREARSVTPQPRPEAVLVGGPAGEDPVAEGGEPDRD